MALRVGTKIAVYRPHYLHKSFIADSADKKSELKFICVAAFLVGIGKLRYHSEELGHYIVLLNDGRTVDGSKNKELVFQVLGTDAEVPTVDGYLETLQEEGGD